MISVGAVRDDCYNFVFDYESGFEQVVRHVVEYHKARHLHMIAGRKDEYFSEKRIAVYKKVLAENKVAFSQDDISYGDYWYGPTTDAVRKLIAENRVPEAVICANDRMAMTACEVFAEHGINVPSDVIVTGFDGTNEARTFMPPITTCKCSVGTACAQITEVICSLFNGSKPPVINRIAYTPDIYTSCGCSVPYVTNLGMGLRKSEERFYTYQENERMLYEMSEKIFLCDSIAEMIGHFSEYSFPSLSIIVNRQVPDPAMNPAFHTGIAPFGEDMLMLYQTNTDIDLFPMPFSSWSQIQDTRNYIEDKNPVIFSSLYFMGLAFGYVAFHFDFNYDNCCRIPQCISCLNNAIGGFRNIRHVRFIAKHDYMTGLYNRNGFYSEAERLIKKHNGSRFMVVSADVDGLKYINDNFGHDSGDFVIREAANALNSFRGKAKICGRFGGDELVLCAALGKDEDGESMLRADIRTYIEAVNSRPGKKFDLSMSIGVCISDPGERDIDDLLKKSDEKMYSEKITKPNRRKR